MDKIEFTQVGDPNKLELDGIYMIDGKEVTAKEHISMGLDISLIHGEALVLQGFDTEKNKPTHNLITNPYKTEVNRSGQ